MAEPLIPVDLAGQLARRSLPGPTRLLLGLTEALGTPIGVCDTGDGRKILSTAQQADQEWRIWLVRPHRVFTGEDHDDAQGTNPLYWLRLALARDIGAGRGATPQAQAALADIAQIDLWAQTEMLRGDAAPDRVDQNLMARMDALRGELAILSDIRARHVEAVVDAEAGTARVGAQTRAAERLGVDDRTISRILKDAAERRDRWQREAQQIDAQQIPAPQAST